MFETLTEKVGNIFAGLQKKGLLREDDIDKALSDLRLDLLEADVALAVVNIIIDRTRDYAKGEAVLKSVSPAMQITKYLHDVLVEMLGSKTATLNLGGVAPHIIMMVGLQGSGKTTSTVKLARYLTKQFAHKPLVASLDIYRPAAKDQLQEFADKNAIACLPAQENEAVDKIAKRAIEAAKFGGHDVLFLDMAGRTQIDDALMLELAQVKTLAKPQEILLVGDAMTGQEAVNIAKGFHERLKLTGIILSRMDGDARGGAALSMHHITGCAIKFIGTGEQADALELFQPERVAGRILGKGDMVSLVEKLQSESDTEQMEKTAEKIKKGRFDFDDMAQQLKQMQKMGGLGKIMDMMPGAAASKMPMKNIDNAMFKKQEAIIGSMTKQERKNPQIIHASRKKRIAAGSGTQVQDINKLIKQFMTMAKMMKRVSMGKNLPPEMMQMMDGKGLPPQF